jgi:hypothetical protein
MVKGLARQAVKQLNRALSVAKVQLVRSGPRPYEEFQDYIPFAPTLAEANRAGLSLGDYIDSKHNLPGTTLETIGRLREMGALHEGVRRICEIGPGSGRYLTRTLDVCKPERYEIYETAQEWSNYLAKRYPVVAQPADGKSLGATADRSVDLVQAHKVFPGTPFLVFRRYMGEMARVVAPNGCAVFDVVTEGCMDDETVKQWLDSGAGYQAYPSLTPKQYIVDFFARNGFAFEGSFLVVMKPGKTECLVFRRKA